MEDFITFSSGTGVEGPGAFDEVAILASFFLAWVAFFSRLVLLHSSI